MATPEGTVRYAQRFTQDDNKSSGYGQFGNTGLTVSNFGFGGYRIHIDSKIHTRALRSSLLKGVNLIDTSGNYTDGASEMLAGKVLNELFEEKKITRDEIVVVTKAGYVQGHNLKQAEKYESDGSPFPDMVKYRTNVWHCIHPEYLEDQLGKSLERLGLDSIDVFLLHNPEYFLSHAKEDSSPDVEAVRKEYYRRIGEAFRWMEEKVASGVIKYYGISSNTFPLSATDFEFTSLEKVIEIANGISSDNHFQVIQFPFNMFESGAASLKNQKEGTKTLLEHAIESGLATMVNRPLNAISNDTLIRLASFKETEPGVVQYEFSGKLQRLSNLEKRFEQEFVSLIPREIPNESVLQSFSWSRQLTNALRDFQNRENWDHIRNEVVLPQVFFYLNYLSEKIGENENWSDWADRYARAILAFADNVSQHYDNLAEQRSKKLCHYLDKMNEELHASKTLSQKALRIAAAIPGIYCVLVGMRRPEYVKDAIEAMFQPKISEPEKLLGDISV